jgi:hypothetical protein
MGGEGAHTGKAGNTHEAVETRKYYEPSLPALSKVRGSGLEDIYHAGNIRLKLCTNITFILVLCCANDSISRTTISTTLARGAVAVGRGGEVLNDNVDPPPPLQRGPPCSIDSLAVANIAD